MKKNKNKKPWHESHAKTEIEDLDVVIRKTRPLSDEIRLVEAIRFFTKQGCKYRVTGALVKRSLK